MRENVSAMLSILLGLPASSTPAVAEYPQLMTRPPEAWDAHTPPVWIAGAYRATPAPEVMLRITMMDEYPGMVIVNPDGWRPTKLAEFQAGGPRAPRPASEGMAAPFPVVQNSVPPLEDDAAAVEGTSCMAVIVSGPARVLFMVHAVKLVAR